MLNYKKSRFIRLSVHNQYLHLEKVEIFIDENLINFRECIFIKDPKIHPLIIKKLDNNAYERQEINIVLNSAKTNDSILELGASIGGMSTVINKFCKPDKYTAVEANRELIDIIKKNHALNNINCTIINAAIGPANGTSDFYVHKECWKSSLTPFPNPVKIDKIKTIPLNSLLEETAANFLICDIEGGEYAIFDNDIDLKGVDKICIEVHPAPLEQMRALYDLFINSGFLCAKPKPDAQRQYVFFFYKPESKQDVI